MTFEEFVWMGRVPLKQYHKAVNLETDNTKEKDKKPNNGPLYNTQIEQHDPKWKPGANSCDTKWQAVHAPLEGTCLVTLDKE